MITIQKRPEKFSPVGNPVIWQVKSDNANLVYFQVTVYDHLSSAVINQLNIFPTPATPTGSFINLSRLLQNVVNWEVNNDSLKLVVPMVKTVRSYRLKITERILNTTTGLLEDGAEYNDTNDISYIFNSRLGRITAHNFLQAKYVVNSTSTASFLTNAPNFKRVTDISAEHLYFMQDGTVPGLRARVRTYSGSGVLIDTEVEALTDLDSNKMYRLNVSPKSLMDSSNFNFQDVAFYVVDVVDSTLTAKTEERVYLYEEAACHLDYLNLLWVNPYGGIDSYTFVAPQDTINVTRFMMSKNIHSVNSDGIYSDVNDNVYNPSDIILDNTVKTTTRINSKELTDAEAYWMQGVYISKQIFVELPDGTLVPALLNNNNYQIPRLKYNRGSLNTISLDIVLADGVIPAGTHVYSSKISSIDFIDSQMNTIQNNLPGYNINVNPGTNNYSDSGYSANYD